MNPRTTAICAAIVVVGAVLLVFGRTLTCDFVGGWDDGPLIYDNPMINPPTAESLGRIWREPHARMYIPAVYTTWWTLARVATVPGETPGTTALNPYVFHAANVIVHAISALLVFAVLRLLVRHDWPAAAGAALFAIHPLQVEPVAWATGMKDLLAGTLSLAAMWQYLCFTTTPGDQNRKRAAHYAIATALFVLALLAKPSGVVVPFMLIAIEWLMLRRPIAQPAGALLPWVALSLGWMFATTTFQPTPEIATPSLVDRLHIAANALGFYVQKLIWPASLGIDYGLRPDVIVRRTLFPFALVAAIGVAVARSRWLIAAGVLFVLGLLPTLGLKPFVFQWLSTVADRYAYLALLGPAVALGMFAAEFRRRDGAALACIVVLFCFAGRSFVQAGVWRNGEVLMSRALSVNPDSPPALNQEGDALFRIEDFAGAYDRFAHAVRVCPTYLVARDNLAVTLMRQERFAEALPLLRETLAMKESLPPLLVQPTDQDLEKIAAVERALAATTHPTTRRRR